MKKADNSLPPWRDSAFGNEDTRPARKWTQVACSHQVLTLVHDIPHAVSRKLLRHDLDSSSVEPIAVPVSAVLKPLEVSGAAPNGSELELDDVARWNALKESILGCHWAKKNCSWGRERRPMMHWTIGATWTSDKGGRSRADDGEQSEPTCGAALVQIGRAHV